MNDNQDIIIGRNAVNEALDAGVSIDKVFIAKGETDSALRRIAGRAREAGIPVIETDRRKLGSMCTSGSSDDNRFGRHVHQGVLATVAAAGYSAISEIMDYAKQCGQQPVIVICDEITDPHNLGAIIRTCEAAGAHGVIVPKRRNAGLGTAVVKASGGAVFHIKTARVSNISAAIRELKEMGVWVYAAAPDGDVSLWDAGFTGATALVIGSEGKGVSRLVSENCDYKVKIPMEGRLKSLNASVSAAVLLYEIYRQRR